MISFMADVIGIRDDMYIGKGNAYMHEVVDAVTEGQQRRDSSAETDTCQPAVRHRPSDTGNGRYAAHHP